MARAMGPRFSPSENWCLRDRATFFSPSENWCLLALIQTLEEREFVVDSGASMHKISKKDLNSAELETVTTSCCPTQPMVKCRRMKRPQCMSKNWIYS